MNETTSQAEQMTADNTSVMRLAEVTRARVADLLARYGLTLKDVTPNADIPGSFWGDEEAGLIGNELLARADTPLHSILHEACHYVCMDETRRTGIHTDAGGDYDEENAVCYLQILLADHIEHFGRQRMLEDMDRWGYTFRLGSAGAWFDRDAGDAQAFLFSYGLITETDQPTFKLRMP